MCVAGNFNWTRIRSPLAYLSETWVIRSASCPQAASRSRLSRGVSALALRGAFLSKSNAFSIRSTIVKRAPPRFQACERLTAVLTYASSIGNVVSPGAQQGGLRRQRGLPRRERGDRLHLGVRAVCCLETQPLRSGLSYMLRIAGTALTLFPPSASLALSLASKECIAPPLQARTTLRSLHLTQCSALAAASD